MVYAALAGVVVALHLAFVAFVVFGAALALRWRWMPLVHVPAASWGVVIEWTGGICPHTPLENRLRVRAGEAAYEGDFVDRYLIATLYPEALTRDIQMLIGGLVLVLNVALYAIVWRRRDAQA